jgi:hypothetical protein
MIDNFHTLETNPVKAARWMGQMIRTTVDFYKAPSINDVTALGGTGCQGFCTKSLLLKSVTMGEGVSNIIKNCVTSFMDDP